MAGRVVITVVMRVDDLFPARDKERCGRSGRYLGGTIPVENLGGGAVLFRTWCKRVRR